MKDPVFIRCKTCRGFGEREQIWFVTHPEKYRGGDALVELIECRVCKGTGKVIFNED